MVHLPTDPFNTSSGTVRSLALDQSQKGSRHADNVDQNAQEHLHWAA